MIKIPQYETLFSLYISLLAILPCILCQFLKKRYKLLDLSISVAIIISILGIHSIQIVEFFLFVMYETLLVFAFLTFRRRCKSELVYYILFFLSMIPLTLIRLCAEVRPTVSMYVGFTGVSYMCFKIWQVLFEIHDGKIGQIKILEFWLFILFFPSFSAGPIARYQGFLDEYAKPIEHYFEDYFCEGLRKLLLGLFYKFAIAFFVNKYVILKIPGEASAINVVAYAYAYTLYLFFDFAGYSNIAIGVAALMGVKLPENFNKPFLACNMKEFWARWHISLSSWFNDYVYGRFVLNNIRNGLFKSTKTAGRFGYLFTMTVMGLWHGFSLHYLIYGLYQGVLLTVTDFWIKTKTYRTAKQKKYYTLVSRVICFQFIAMGMLLFSGHYFFN